MKSAPTTHGPWRFALAAASLGALSCAHAMPKVQSTPAVAQETTPTPAADEKLPSIADAQARLQADDPAGAAEMLERIVAREANNPAAFRLLGVAHQRAHSLDAAATAYFKSLELQPNHPLALYNLGTVFALQDKADEAFVWLAKARATGRIDMEQVKTDSDLASVRDDPRFETLLPRPEDFRDPFVEPVTILREWAGEAANDQFGWIARNIGDVDGDQIPDVVTSAPTKSLGGPPAGRVYVYSTKGGQLLWSADGQAGDQLGTGLEGAGDTNHDGIPDVIAAAPGGGYAKVYSGRDGAVLLTLEGEDKANDQFGRHAAGIGDVDGDGCADVVVGAPGNSSGGAGAGRAYIFSGKDGAKRLTLTGERAGDGFGSAVAGSTVGKSTWILVGAPAAGPDRHGRVYASDWSNSAKGPSTGRVYVHSGRDGRRLFAFTGETAGEGFGTSPSNAGDVDGDGHADFIVGAWQYWVVASSAGRAYLYSGKDGKLMKTFTCRIPGDTFGFDAVTMGDVDGDRMTDFLITSAWSHIHGFHSGRVFVLSSGIKRP